MALRIGIDAFPILQVGGGLKRYGLGLIQEMVRLEPENEYTLFFVTWRQEFLARMPFLAQNHPSIQKKILRLPKRLVNAFWLRFSYPPIESILGSLDLYHSLYLVLPPARKAKRVLTVTDLGPLLYPSYYADSRLSGYEFGYLFPKMVSQADKIIAISEFTKKELINFFYLDEKKIQVIYLGFDQVFLHPPPFSQNSRIIEKGIVDRPFFLYVAGTLEPRKNIEGLVEAFFSLPESIKKEYRLVITAVVEDRKRGKELFRENKEKVFFLSNLSKEELLCLYQKASCFVYPSFHEGFGLPVLEAMASGVPVIASNTSSLPEVVGKGGILIDPKNREELVEAMRRVVSDEKLRESLVKEGVEQAKKFSWERTARETLALYHELAE